MRNLLNIAMLSIHSCPFARLGSRDTGGMNVYIRELCAELAAQGCRIDIFTASHRCGHCFVLNPEQAIHLYHLKSRLAGDATRDSFDTYVSSLADEICQIQQQGSIRYDIIHSHYWQSGIVGVALQKLWGIPHLTMFHTLSAVKKVLHVPHQDPDFRLPVEKIVAQDPAGIITSTSREREYLKRFYDVQEQKIETIPCGVNLNTFQPVARGASMSRLGMAGKEKIILYVGRLDPLKGIEQLLRTLPLIREKYSSRLLILGEDSPDGNYLSYLKQICDDLGIYKYTDFIGSIAQVDLACYYSAADVCVIPSYYESFCLVLLESLACGTPVVASNTGIAESVITQPSRGMLLENNHPEQMAAQIVRLLQTHKKTDSDIRACRMAVEGYGWPDISARIRSAYMRLISLPQHADIGSYG